MLLVNLNGASSAGRHPYNHTQFDTLDTRGRGFASSSSTTDAYRASMRAPALLPLATGYSLTEAFGLERGVNKSIREAPVFWDIVTELIALGIIVGVLIPHGAVVQLLPVAQVVNGVLPPILRVFSLRLVNNPEIVSGDRNGGAPSTP